MHPAKVAPDSSAVCTALWRAMHVRIDEDLLVQEGIGQYILLGAGLDTFVQRHPELATQVMVFEIDQAGPQAWKRQRLEDLGYGVADSLRLIPVDFEAGEDWWRALVDEGLDTRARALVSSSGVSMYITKVATQATLRRLAALVPGSIVFMTFMLPFDLLDDADRPGLEAAARGAQASGTPWLSFYRPEEITALARDAGFVDARTISTADLAERYLAGRADGLRAAGGESVLVART